MKNEFTLEGKLISEPQQMTTKKGTTFYNIELLVKRTTHKLSLFQDPARKISQFKTGALIGIKGEVGVRLFTAKSGVEYSSPELRVHDLYEIPSKEFSMAPQAEAPTEDDPLSQIPF